MREILFRGRAPNDCYDHYASPDRILDTEHKGRTFPLTSQTTYNDRHGVQSAHAEIIGNIHDNFGLLEV